MSRIYGQITDISENAVADFWSKKTAAEGLKAVLLGKTADNSEQRLRNAHEKELVRELIKKHFKADKKISVLDIGCGYGRWCENLREDFYLYCGIDGSKQFIDEAKAFFPEPSCSFHIFNLNDFAVGGGKRLLNQQFDLVVITGVLMYLNDEVTAPLLKELSALVKADGIFYIQESVSFTDERLTLKDFYSQDLQTYYSAIYRKISEYEDMFKKSLADFAVDTKGLLLDDGDGARSETNAEYWCLKRKN